MNPENNYRKSRQEDNNDEYFGTDYFEMEAFLQNSYDDLSPRTSSPIPESDKRKRQIEKEDSTCMESSATNSTVSETKSYVSQQTKTKPKKDFALKIKLSEKKNKRISIKSISKTSSNEDDDFELPSTSKFTAKLPSKSQNTNDSIFQIKILLKHVKPPIWRRIQIPSNITFATLHKYIQEAMGWRSCHLYEFTMWVPNNHSSQNCANLTICQTEKITKYMKQKGDKICYQYDFGDSWDHIIQLEKVLPFTGKKSDYPKLLIGRRACPPEDCGGSIGYEHLVEVFYDPDHPEYQELINEWLLKLYPNWHPDKYTENY